MKTRYDKLLSVFDERYLQILKDTPKPTSGDGSAGTSGVDRERTMSVKERLGLKKTESGPSNAKVAATFGQPKAAWQYAANDATTPALVTVVEQATKSKSPTGLGKGEVCMWSKFVILSMDCSCASTQDLIIKVRYHDTRRMRVKPDISVQALEARIMEKFGMKESVDLWWSDQGRATRLSGQRCVGYCICFLRVLQHSHLDLRIPV